MMNMQKMMKEAQKLQKEMQEQQEALTKTTFVGKSAQELVTAMFTGNKKMTDLVIKPELADPEDVETLQAMIIEAANDALGQIDRETESKFGGLTQGMGLPF